MQQAGRQHYRRLMTSLGLYHHVMLVLYHVIHRVPRTQTAMHTHTHSSGETTPLLTVLELARCIQTARQSASSSNCLVYIANASATYTQTFRNKREKLYCSGELFQIRLGPQEVDFCRLMEQHLSYARCSSCHSVKALKPKCSVILPW